MQRFSFSLLPLALMLLLAGCASEPERRTPNVVIIFADDLGYGDLGAYGHPTIDTPHLDRMADEGMRFTQFYVAASVCTPSRAGLLTGRLPIRNGMAGGRRVLFPNSALGIPASEITIAEALKDRGYATAAVGKWHLGHRPGFLPTDNGFDYYFGIPYSNDMSPATNDWAGAQGFPPTPLLRNTETIEEEPDQRELTARYTREATEWIRARGDEPFFLYFAHTFPHTPLYASERFEGTSRRGLYGDVVEELDWSVGEVLATLRDLGIAERTLVFFTSDNGPWLVMDQEGGSAGLLRNGKGTTWEGGMREPAIAWWPGSIQSGATSDAIATTLDLLPTVLSVTGADLPDDRTLDGVDLSPVLRMETEQVRDTVFFYRQRRLYAVRKGPWKAHFITQNAYRDDTGPTEHDPPLLFHLEHDPSENFNIAEQHPDVIEDIRATVAAHQAALEPPPSQLDSVLTLPAP